jgi:hypothetical protein
MTGPTPPPRAHRGGLAALIIGGVILLTSGLCTGGLVVAAAPDTGGYGPAIIAFALVLGVPTMLVGLGLVALGLRQRKADPGPPPLWHAVVGWLLMTVGGVIVLAEVAMQAWSLFHLFSVRAEQGGDPGGVTVPVSVILLTTLASAAIPTIFGAAGFWLGRTLTRPRR